MIFQTQKAKWHEDSDGLWISFNVNDRIAAIKAAQEVQDKLFDIEVKLHKKKRSLDANAYMWTLLDKLATVLNVPKTEIYNNFIRDIGGNCETVCVLDGAVDKLRTGWSHNGIGWPTDTLPSKIDGCTNVVLYYGSSTYDTAQMSRLVNLVVDDCKAQGIETMTLDELCKLKGLYDG